MFTCMACSFKSPSIHRAVSQIHHLVSPTLHVCYWRASAHLRHLEFGHRGGLERGSMRAERRKVDCPYHPHPPIPNTNYAPLPVKKAVSRTWSVERFVPK